VPDAIESQTNKRPPPSGCDVTHSAMTSHKNRPVFGDIQQRQQHASSLHYT